MTQQELLDKMTPQEFKQWVAYFSLRDEEYREKMEKENALKEMESKTQEELAIAMRNMIMGLNN